MFWFGFGGSQYRIRLKRDGALTATLGGVRSRIAWSACPHLAFSTEMTRNQGSPIRQRNSAHVAPGVDAATPHGKRLKAPSANKQISRESVAAHALGTFGSAEKLSTGRIGPSRYFRGRRRHRLSNLISSQWRRSWSNRLRCLHLTLAYASSLS